MSNYPEKVGNTSVYEYEEPPCNSCPKFGKCTQYKLACMEFKEFSSTGSVVKHLFDREPNHYIWRKLFSNDQTAPHRNTKNTRSGER